MRQPRTGDEGSAGPPLQGAINGDIEIKLALGGLHLGDVDVEIAEGGLNFCRCRPSYFGA